MIYQIKMVFINNTLLNWKMHFAQVRCGVGMNVYQKLIHCSFIHIVVQKLIWHTLFACSRY